MTTHPDSVPGAIYTDGWAAIPTRHLPSRRIAMTLIELLVAIALSTLLVVALSGLILVFSQQLRITEDVAQRLTTSQRLAELLERDLIVTEYWRVASGTVDLRIGSGIDLETGSVTGCVQVLRYRAAPQGLVRERLQFAQGEWRPRERMLVTDRARDVLAGPADHNERELRALSTLQDTHWKPRPNRLRLIVLGDANQLLAEGVSR